MKNRKREPKSKLKEQVEPLLTALEGNGPLLQRDYWAVIKNCRLNCREVALFVKEHFPTLPPESLVVFRKKDGKTGPLQVDDEMEVEIRMAGKTAVRVIHEDGNSITLCTMQKHPEAGRITFGAYRNEKNDVVFHIRSRARSSSIKNLVGFLTTGDAMQTNTWTDFIDRLSHMVGDGVVGAIYVETSKIEEEDAESVTVTPTFIARGT